MALNFATARGDARPAKVVALRRRATSKIDVPEVGPPRFYGDSPQTAVAAPFFLEGSELDEGSTADRERARTAYRKALLLDPNLVPAIVNLANLHYAQDELVEAHALYARALNLDEDCFEAHFNLGNIHHDLGRYDAAVGYYFEALRLNAGYADVHFYLAVTLEKMGRSDNAKPALARLPAAGAGWGVGRSRQRIKRVSRGINSPGGSGRFFTERRTLKKAHSGHHASGLKPFIPE